MIKFVKEQIERLVKIGDKKYLTEVRKINGLRVSYTATSRPGHVVKHLHGRIKNNNEVANIVILVVNSVIQTIDISGKDKSKLSLNLREDEREQTIHNILNSEKENDRELEFEEYIINEETGVIESSYNVSHTDNWKKTKYIMLAEIEDEGNFKLVDKNNVCYAELTTSEYFDGKSFIWKEWIDAQFEKHIESSQEYIINEETGVIELSYNVSHMDNWRKTRHVTLAEIEDGDSFKLIDKNNVCYAELTASKYFAGKHYIWKEWLVSQTNNYIAAV